MTGAQVLGHQMEAEATDKDSLKELEPIEIESEATYDVDITWYQLVSYINYKKSYHVPDHSISYPITSYLCMFCLISLLNCEASKACAIAAFVTSAAFHSVMSLCVKLARRPEGRIVSSVKALHQLMPKAEFFMFLRRVGHSPRRRFFGHVTQCRCW